MAEAAEEALAVSMVAEEARVAVVWETAEAVETDPAKVVAPLAAVAAAVAAGVVRSVSRSRRNPCREHNNPASLHPHRHRSISRR